MLHKFIVENRDEIIELVRKRAHERSPRADEATLVHGVPLFLLQLAAALERRPLEGDAAADSSRLITKSAALHGQELLKQGYSASQVVHGYGDVCQAVTELASARHAQISSQEFQLFNRCLDDAIAGAVTAYGQRREQELASGDTRRQGVLAHELRNLLNTATLAFNAMKRGVVGLNGSTGSILGRSLSGLRTVVDRSVTLARLEGAGLVFKSEALDSIVEEVQLAAQLEADVYGITLVVEEMPGGVWLEVDRQSILSALANLLQNAFKFTRTGGRVVLAIRLIPDRVVIEVRDECGGLPSGRAEQLFQPFTQFGTDVSGLGLGLSIVRDAVRANRGEVRAHDIPGNGCVFAVELPRHVPTDK